MQSSTLLFVLGVAVLVACASAGKKKDTRPACYKEPTEEQTKERQDLWKKCNDSLSDEDKKKEGKELCNAIAKCVMKEKKMVNENDEVQEEAMKKMIEEYAANEDYKKALTDLVTKCIATPKCDKFHECMEDKSKDLPCSCHKRCKKGKKGDKKGSKESKESSEEKKDEENKQEGAIPT